MERGGRGRGRQEVEANKRVKGPFRGNAEQNLFSPSRRPEKVFVLFWPTTSFPEGGYSPLHPLPFPRGIKEKGCKFVFQPYKDNFLTCKHCAMIEHRGAIIAGRQIA